MPFIKLNFHSLWQLASPIAFVLVEIDPLDHFLGEVDQRIFRIVFACLLEMFHSHNWLEEMEVAEGEVSGGRKLSGIELGIEADRTEVVACLEGQHACVVQDLLFIRTIFKF